MNVPYAYSARIHANLTDQYFSQIPEVQVHCQVTIVFVRTDFFAVSNFFLWFLSRSTNKGWQII